MSTLLYYKPADSSTGNSLVVRSDNQETVKEYMSRYFPILCEKNNVKCLPCTHSRLVENGISFATLEFAPETTEDEILRIIGQFERFYPYEFSTQSVLLEPPTRIVLDSWGLL